MKCPAGAETQLGALHKLRPKLSAFDIAFVKPLR
jgi:hypothetical protein